MSQREPLPLISSLNDFKIDQLQQEAKNKEVSGGFYTMCAKLMEGQNFVMSQMVLTLP